MKNTIRFTATALLVDGQPVDVSREALAAGVKKRVGYDLTLRKTTC